MSVNARVVTLDGTGHGKITVAPGFYLGARKADPQAIVTISSVTAENGTNLGTAFLTRGTAIAVEGAIDVSATPDADVVLYFDFD